MRKEEKIKEAAKSYADKIQPINNDEIDRKLSRILGNSFLIGARSESAAEYHKEKNGWYSEDEVSDLASKYKTAKTLLETLSMEGVSCFGDNRKYVSVKDIKYVLKQLK